MGRVDGKVAVVTGAGSGIGASSASLLAREGAQVVVADINPESAAATVRQIILDGGKAIAVSTDIRDEASVRNMIAVAVEEFGRLDILHNNAALTTAEILSADGRVTDVDIEVWDAVLETNLRGCWLGCKHAIPSMIESGGGSIINTSSNGASTGDVSLTAYACSKGGINALTLRVATQFGRDNIRCNAILPGVTMTRTSDSVVSESIRNIRLSDIPIPRLGQPLDHAWMVVFLGSDESTWITGQLIHIDGGTSCHDPSYSRLINEV
jgi:NAD(P)-dependent dehydrogenase (short-subunit alcohol dehydrogenase family)